MPTCTYWTEKLLFSLFNTQLSRRYRFQNALLTPSYLRIRNYDVKRLPGQLRILFSEFRLQLQLTVCLIFSEKKI
jgi:hypothetical protein